MFTLEHSELLLELRFSRMAYFASSPKTSWRSFPLEHRSRTPSSRKSIRSPNPYNHRSKPLSGSALRTSGISSRDWVDSAYSRRYRYRLSSCICMSTTPLVSKKRRIRRRAGTSLLFRVSPGGYRNLTPRRSAGSLPASLDCLGEPTVVISMHCLRHSLGA